MMKLVVDVGNTNIKFAFYKEFEQQHFISIPTRKDYNFKQELENIFKQVDLKDITVTIYVSVVPSIDELFINELRAINLNVFVIDTSIKTNVILNQIAKKELGNDLLCLAAIGYYIFNQEFLAISMGTASALIHIDDSGTLKHSLIFPGLKSGARNLFDSAEKLEAIDISKPESILALNTNAALRAGIAYAYIGSIDYILRRYQQELDRDFLVIASGGLGQMVKDGCDIIDYYDRDLVIKGALFLYEYNQ